MNILILDVETAPTLLWAWGLHQEIHSTDFMHKDWYMLCWAAKWLGEKKIISASLPDFKEYKTDKENDKALMEALWPLLDKADIVIAHNGINFDRRKINARFIMNGLNPTSPYRMIDTLDTCKREFAFTSNKLGDVAKFLGVGQKVQTGGFQLWKDCMNGIMSSWKKMTTYCCGDIHLLEKVYLKLRPYMLMHPNVSVESEDACCTACGSDNINFRGYKYTNLSKFRQFVCLDCGHWSRLRINELPNKVLSANA